jgi:flagellar FliL protein
MADEMFDDDSDVVGAEEAQSGEKRVGFLSGVLIQVLKWVGIILGAVIFIVTVVVVTVNFLNRGNVSQTRIPTSEEYRAESPIYSWFEQIGELRGSTGDEVRTTYIVEPFLGYDGSNEALVTELIDRRIQLIGIFNDYFGSRTTDELQGQNNKIKVEQELKDQINRIMRSGRVDEIVFGSYQFLPF